MSKQKKKRNKPYRGSEASVSTPVVTRIQAVQRNAAQQWWIDHKRIAKPVLIAGGVVIFLGWIIIEGMMMASR